MKYKAVIFDLFGTLVDNLPSEEYRNILRQVASVLTVPLDDFRRLWSETAHERGLGAFPTVEANIEYICDKLGVSIDNTKIGHAARLRYNLFANTMKPRQDAIDVLSFLRTQGFKTGLISNCSPETPLIWENTPFPPLFDAVVFSATAGIKKPDPRIYHLALEQLAVEPESCLFIGDGANQELTGAASVGLHPVMIRISYEDKTQPRMVGSREDWHGPVISSLKEVLTLVK